MFTANFVPGVIITRCLHLINDSWQVGRAVCTTIFLVNGDTYNIAYFERRDLICNGIQPDSLFSIGKQYEDGYNTHRF